MVRKLSQDNPVAGARTLKLYLILTRCAARRATVTYPVLAEQLHTITPAVGSYLGPVADYCETNGLPQLVCLAVSSTTGEPGDAYPDSWETLYRDREKVYQCDWLDLEPPTVEQLSETYGAQR